ncbi:MAG: tRNA (guanosine(46)-N7)-methyltransferase TrmB [Thiotrichales bacterium]|nr:tRNA (guanosine(46)-N7)-methyltransferase TrmB [Thiotrichales bacterium]
MSQPTDRPIPSAAELPAEPSTAPEKYSTRIRSFALRQGRLTASQERALNALWPQFGLTVEQGVIDFAKLFGRQAPTLVEIGFGMGKSLAEMAQANPENNYIGIEVHKPGVGALLRLIEEKQLSNVRIFNHDAIEVLEQCIAPNSLDAVYLFFPDPWHKARHHKRRIVKPEFVANIAKHLKIGGQFHMATDWENYAEQMLEVMSAAPDYVNFSGVGNYTPRPDYRPLTKFEARGHRLGHGVWDLIFTRVERNG